MYCKRFLSFAKTRNEGQSGVALLTTLLLLMLLTGMGMAMMMALRGDLLVNGYYRNYRSSFYAADSGLNIARQAMYNQLQNDITALQAANFNPTSGQPPLTIGEGGTTNEDQVLQNAALAYNTWQNLTGSTQGADPTNSWPAQFNITAATVTPLILTISCGKLTGSSQSYTPATCNCGSLAAPASCTNPTGAYVSTPVQAYILCTNTASTGGSTTTETVSCPFSTTGTWPVNAVSYQYYYQYALTSQGRTSAANNEQTTVNDSGYIMVSSSNQQVTNFAGYGMFINSQTACSSGDLVGGTFTGPVFTNGAWTFGTSSYTFVNTVGQSAAAAGYDFGGGNCFQPSGATQDSFNGTSIKPTYDAGTLKLGESTVPLPTDSFSQEQAVVDSQGLSPFSQSSPGNLKTASGTPFPTSGTVPNGVYIPYSGSTSGGTAAYTGGGILVQGDASVVLSPGANGAQVYTIAQVNGGTTTTTTVTITPNGTPGGGTTSVSQQIGSAAATSYAISGVPVIDNVNDTTSDSMMLYVNGNVTSLSGPNVTCSSPPCTGGQAIQNGTDITVTAADSVTITGNITYASSSANEPVTMNTADTLTSAASSDGILGIFTAGAGCVGSANCGNINLNFPTNNGNWEIDASMATISSNNTGSNSGQLVNTGNAINTLDIIGGRIQNTIGNINTATRNVYFDQRFAGGVSPPWFPSTTVTSTGFSTSGTIQRASWVNNSANY